MRILMFTGKGGVGKTSLAAATGVKLAALNYRTLVMSIDPGLLWVAGPMFVVNFPWFSFANVAEYENVDASNGLELLAGTTVSYSAKTGVIDDVVIVDLRGARILLVTVPTYPCLRVHITKR